MRSRKDRACAAKTSLSRSGDGRPVGWLVRFEGIARYLPQPCRKYALLPFPPGIPLQSDTGVPAGPTTITLADITSACKRTPAPGRPDTGDVRFSGKQFFVFAGNLGTSLIAEALAPSLTHNSERDPGPRKCPFASREENTQWRTTT